jgi:hypothetical protein
VPARPRFAEAGQRLPQQRRPMRKVSLGGSEHAEVAESQADLPTVTDLVPDAQAVLQRGPSLDELGADAVQAAKVTEGHRFAVARAERAEYRDGLVEQHPGLVSIAGQRRQTTRNPLSVVSVPPTPMGHHRQLVTVEIPLGKASDRAGAGRVSPPAELLQRHRRDRPRREFAHFAHTGVRRRRPDTRSIGPSTTLPPGSLHRTQRSPGRGSVTTGR